MRLIGLNGGMGVGKSTAIELLRAQGETVSVVKFAQPLYDVQEFLYSRISSVYSRPESFVKDRKLLQWIGTDWGRETLSQTLWVDLWKAEVRRLSATGALIVCDDVRFDNEAEAVHALGGVVIKITSDRALDRITTANGIQNHKSEAGIRPSLVDFIIQNNCTLADFNTALCEVYHLMAGQGEEAI